MRSILFCVRLGLATLLFLGCSHAPAHPSTPGLPFLDHQLDAEEYWVLTAVLKHQTIAADRCEVVLVDRLRAPHRWREQLIEGLRADTVQDFERKATDPRRLLPPVQLKCPVRLLSKEEESELFSSRLDSGWKRFHERFPNAGRLLSLSRAGFSEDKTQALVYLSEGSGPLAGEGLLFLLERRGEEWQVVKDELLWIAGRERARRDFG